ncbi:universal stress protein [Caulifigura coniformis]|nr:universal stress protein [Caulifigura coniformis]
MSCTSTESRATTRPLHSIRVSPPQFHHGASLDDAVARRLDSIVVPLDGSEFSEHAIPFAAALARRANAVLKLVRAWTPTESAMLHPGSGVFDLIEGRRRTEARLSLDNVQRRFGARMAEVTVVSHLVQASSIPEALSRVARTSDLVVMATHGRGWLGRLIHGSVGRDLLHERKRPIVYLRGYDSPVDFSADPVPRHVTIGLDGRKASEQVLEMSGIIARISCAKATILHVDDPGEPDERFAHSSPEAYLRWAGRTFTATAPEVETQIVRDAANPARGILSFVDDSESDLIAVTSRSARPSLTSTTENLIRRSRVPVLVVRE